MELYLRPMGLGELLDRSLNLYRQNFLLFLAIIAIVELPLALAQVISAFLFLPAALAGGASVPNGLSLLGYYGTSLLLGLLRGVGLVVQMAALSIAVSERYHERATTLKQVYGRALRRWDSLLVLILVIGAANLGVVIVLFAPIVLIAALSAGASSSASGVLAALGFSFLCLGFIPAIVALTFLNTRWAFSFPAAVLENLRATRALGRSWNLVKGYFWRVLGTLFMLGLFIYILILVPTSLISFAVLLLAANSLVLGTVANAIISTLISLLVTPIQFAVITLLYYDIRIRKEGYDLQVRADAMILPPSLTTEPGASPSIA